MKTEKEVRDRIETYKKIKADRTSWRCRQKYGEVIHNLKWVLGEQ